MDEPEPAGVDYERWNELAIISAVAGLAASLCGLVGFLSFSSTLSTGPLNASWLGMLLFAPVAIGTLLASFYSPRRRGSSKCGILGAVFGLLVPFAFTWWLLSNIWL